MHIICFSCKCSSAASCSCDMHASLFFIPWWMVMSTPVMAWSSIGRWLTPQNRIPFHKPVPKFYRTQKFISSSSPSLLSQVNPLHIISFFEIHLNINLPQIPKSLSLPKYCMHLSSLMLDATCFVHLIILYMTTLIILWGTEGMKLFIMQFSPSC